MQIPTYLIIFGILRAIHFIFYLFMFSILNFKMTYDHNTVKPALKDTSI